MLIIAYLSKEFVIFHHLWVEHITPLFLTRPHSSEHGCVCLQIFTCPPSQLAWQCAYLAILHICLFLSQEMLEEDFNALKQSLCQTIGVCAKN